MKSFILGPVIIVLTVYCSPQQPASAPSGAAPQARIRGEAGPAPTGQAPDDLTNKITVLVHAGKYAEAQQLTTGLPVAYPNDPRLIKAKALIGKLLASAGQATAGSGQPAASADAGQLTGMDKLEYNTLLELARHQTLLWRLRAASAISLNDPMAGYEAGQTLLAEGAADSNDPNLQRLLAQLNSKGWLDKQKAQVEQLTGMERMDYDALIELARLAQQSTDLEQQKPYLEQFLDQSGLFLQKHPDQMLLWQLRAASAISLNEPMAGYEAGQKLMAMGAADSSDPSSQRLLAQLNNKGWLDKQEATKQAEEERKENSNPQAIIETSMGDIHCTLLPNQAPIGVANFIGLARGTKDWTSPVSHKIRHGVPLYDGTIFHRVIPSFMIQGGDPAEDGTGDPGYQFENEASPDVRFDRPGRLAYANAGPGTNGSQFFIAEAPAPSLDGKYTIFGHCENQELVHGIISVPRDRRDKPLTPVLILHIKIIEGTAN